MRRFVVFAIVAGVLGIPAIAVAQLQQASPVVQHSVSVDHHSLDPAQCVAVKQMLAARGLAAQPHPCRITSVMEQWESGVGHPKAASASALAASGCNVFRRKSCPAQREKRVYYKFNECFGMFDHCTKHDSPAWWKVQQVGRYYKGWPCRVSSTIPGPYNCKRYYTWTRDNTWHWHHYNPPNRLDGFHRCNSVSGSGASTSIDS